MADNFARRGYDLEMGVDSLTPIETLQTRVSTWRELTSKRVAIYIGDLCDADFTYRMVGEFAPDAIAHYAEQRAAPYSMVDCKHAVYTQTNNVVGNLNVLYAIAEITRSGRAPSLTCPRSTTVTTSSSPAASGASGRLT